MSKPRVLIADDHQILAEGLRGLLEPEFEVVGVVADGRELVAAAKKHRPDVIVADITMPSLNGIEAAVQLRDVGVKAKVVFLTMHRDVAYARRAMEAGAVGLRPEALRRLRTGHGRPRSAPGTNLRDADDRRGTSSVVPRRRLRGRATGAPTHRASTGSACSSLPRAVRPRRWRRC